MEGAGAFAASQQHAWTALPLCYQQDGRLGTSITRGRKRGDMGCVCPK